MKFTKKGIFITLFVVLLGVCLILAPSYLCGFIKNTLVAYENKKEALKEDHWIYDQEGRRFVYHDGTFIEDASHTFDGVTYYFATRGDVKTGWIQES